MKEYILINNEEESQYEFHIDGHIATLTYFKEEEDLMLVTFVEVPTELEGQGVASQLVEKALLDIEAKGFKIIALCHFVEVYIQRHPEWERILYVAE